VGVVLLLLFYFLFYGIIIVVNFFEIMSSNTMLQFAPFSSALDAGFWHRFSQLKLDIFGLNDDMRPIVGYYCNSDADLLPPHVSLDYTAFDVERFVAPPRCFPIYGQLKNTNTLEEFRTCDKRSLLDAQGNQIWDDIISGKAIDDPSVINRFMLLTHADLKHYRYYYWFAFIAASVTNVNVLGDPVLIGDRFTELQICSLVESFDAVNHDSPAAMFVIHDDGEKLEIKRLNQFASLATTGVKLLFGFCDPCTLRMHPGWPLRNLLALIAHHWKNYIQDTVEVVCFRDRTKDGRRTVLHSIVLNLHIPDILPDTSPKFFGWEKNEKQKIGPRMVDLSASMDPRKLADSAVDLNLKLMRWRLLPELDLEKISSTRCLLLGAGTLGCNVARCLLGWGIRNITLVDNGTVSYSNPVRQSLFVFEDSLNGGQQKAAAAAEALCRIFPGVNAVGVQLSIPMPGHTVSDAVAEAVKHDVEQLKLLFDNHDAVFLLMDTRESRWLPTVLGTAMNKLVINAALGFDTYLVVRHSVRDNTAGVEVPERNLADLSKCIPGEQLGCYFCNDVVAPGDSTRDRTLDQQCTVSRPGLSMMAASVAVELFVSVLVHPLGGRAPADTSSHDDHLLTQATSPLGIVPHQIRGFLSRFHNMMPVSAAFDRCTACSQAVIDGYSSGGFPFLLDVFNQPSFLEDLTGLSRLQMETLETEMWNISDFEDSECDL